MRRTAVLLAFGALLTACRSPASRTAPAPLPPCPAPAVDVVGWEVVDRGTFAFRLPPGFRQVPARGTDSYVERFEADGGHAAVSVNFGWYSDDLHRDPEFYARYERCSEVIGGRAATVISGVVRNPHSRRQDGRQVAAATWRNLYDAPDTSGTQGHLTIWGETRDPRRLPELLAMLRTVELRRR